MRAIRVTRFGGPEVLVPTELPDSAPGPDQVVVQVVAADVLHLDTLIRSGRATAFFPIRPPYIPGNGVAGRVVATGVEVDPGWAGREVIVRTGGRGGFGGYAERAVVPAEDLVPVPPGLDTRRAAALLHDGATALGLLECVTVKPDDRVLITGAAGGMGLLLVRLVRDAGATVVAAARGARKLDAAREAGATAVVDYSHPGWTDRVREITAGHGTDVVLDGAGGALGVEAFATLAAGGRFSAHGAPGGGFAAVDPAEAERRGVTVTGIEQVTLEPPAFRRLAARALDMAAAGTISPLIGQVFPLDRAPEAHAAIESRTALGKTLLIPS